MTKPTLDQIEIDIIKERIDLRVPQVREAMHSGNLLRYAELSQQLEKDAHRYKHLTGKWYTYRKAEVGE